MNVVLGRIQSHYRFGYSESRITNWEKVYQNWPLYSVGELPSKPEELKVYFYQTLVNLRAPSEILYYKISLVFDGGIIMFVNGNEIYRQFISNDATDSTGPHRVDVIGQQTIKFLPYYFIDGLNLISFEIHSTKSRSSDPFEMTIDVETSLNNCSLNLNFPKMYGHTSTEGGNENEYIFKAFDGNKQTKYFTRAALPIRFTLFFPESRGFNKFIIVTADDCCSRDPKDFDILGIMKAAASYENKAEFKDAVYMKNISYSGSMNTCPKPDSINDGPNRNTPNPFELDNKRAYNGYSLNVKSVQSATSTGCGNDGLQFAEIEMYSCKVKKCQESDILPEAFVATEIIRPCQYGLTKMKYICGDNGVWGTTDSCPSISKI